MKYRRLSLLAPLSFILFAAMAPPVNANDLQYDWLENHRNLVLREWIGQTRHCMAQAMRSKLLQGERESQKITGWAVEACGQHLRNVLGSGMQPGEVDNFLKSMAEVELEKVPGLSRSDAGQSSVTGSSSKGGRKSVPEVRNDQYQRCLTAEVKLGKYSSSDGGDSIGRLLTSCSTTWYASVNSCMIAGDTKENCTIKSLELIKKTIKKYEK